MRHILLAFILILCAATTLPAQNPYISGSVQGGQPAPGTNSRSPLNSLERAANNTPGATILTDTFGNQRFSRFVYISDTCFTPAPTGNTSNLNSFLSNCAGDSTWYVDWTGKSTVLFAGVPVGGVNWYNTNDTTTDVTRMAYILQNAVWQGLDPEGYIDMIMGSVAYGELYIDPNESGLFHFDLAGLERIRATTDGIDLTTSNTASRAVDITTDTMNWASSFDPTFMSINYLADATYMYADSTKTVALGQFPSIPPSYNNDGTEKGFFYSPIYKGFISIINGNGVTGSYSDIEVLPSSTKIQASKKTGVPIYGITSFDTVQFYSYQAYRLMEGELLNSVVWNSNNPKTDVHMIANRSGPGPGSIYVYDRVTKDSAAIIDGWDVGLIAVPDDTSSFDNAHVFLGYNIDGTQGFFHSSRYAWGVQSKLGGADTTHFNYINVFLDEGIFANSISFYDKYPWSNTTPSATVGDTVFHYWAGNGTVTDPGFISIDQVCAHCTAGAVNWYNSNGTTTDNTRIATVTETATWLSADGDLNNVYPFRFELQDATANEPEMMVWKFPGTDSLKLNQSDQEIRFQSTNRFNIESADELSLLGDSIQYYKNGVGPMWRVTGGNSVIQGPEGNSSLINQVIHSSGSFAANGDAQSMEVVLRRAITGTAATELFLDGSSVQARLPGPNTIWTGTVKCTGSVTAVGNGTTIVVGDTYATWQPITIKRIGTATTLMTPVIGTTVEGWQDTNMGGSAFTITADNTTEALKITFTPPTLAGTTTVCRAVCTVNVNTVAF